MIERDVAEFVDDDRGLAQRLILEQAVEQRRLAGAEEAGEHGQGNWIRRPAPIGALGTRAHCLAETFAFARFAVFAGFAALAVSEGFPALPLLATCFLPFFGALTVCSTLSVLSGGPVNTTTGGSV